MKFLLSEDQNALFQAVSDYANDKCDSGVRRAAFESNTGFDAAFWAGLLELGLGAIAIDPNYGGMGLELMDTALAAEALGYAGAPGPFLGHVLAGQALSLAGTEEQKQRWLPRLCTGEVTATVAFAEPGERYTPGQWQAELSNNRLNGHKRDVLYPEIADLTVVGVRGGFALVERDAPGQTLAPFESADRTRRLSHVTYSDVPAEFMPAAQDTCDTLMDAALVLLSADAFGGAVRMLNISVEYAKTREQFGRFIAQFQALRHQLANMAVDIEASRGLYWYAAHAQDIRADDRRRVAALAKAHLGDVFMQSARAAIEAHGGMGYTWECDAQIWLKRAMFDFAYLGPPSRHRDRAADLAGWGR